MSGLEITVETRVTAPIEIVWEAYVTPEDIIAWNAASEDWHTTMAQVDLREGGAFLSRMEAKDGSMGFDFCGIYRRVEPCRLIEYVFDDRSVRVEFVPQQGDVLVRVTFDAEAENSVELQRQGWQSILRNFARHVAGR